MVAIVNLYMQAGLIDSLLSPEPAKRPSAEFCSGTQLRELRRAIRKSKITHVKKL